MIAEGLMLSNKGLVRSTKLSNFVFVTKCASNPKCPSKQLLFGLLFIVSLAETVNLLQLVSMTCRSRGLEQCRRVVSYVRHLQLRRVSNFDKHLLL